MRLLEAGTNSRHTIRQPRRGRTSVTSGETGGIECSLYTSYNPAGVERWNTLQHNIVEPLQGSVKNRGEIVALRLAPEGTEIEPLQDDRRIYASLRSENRYAITNLSSL